MIAHVNAEDQTHTPVLFRHPNTQTPTTLIQEKTSSWKSSFFLNKKKTLELLSCGHTIWHCMNGQKKLLRSSSSLREIEKRLVVLKDRKKWALTAWPNATHTSRAICFSIGVNSTGYLTWSKDTKKTRQSILHSSWFFRFNTFTPYIPEGIKIHIHQK